MKNGKSEKRIVVFDVFHEPFHILPKFEKFGIGNLGRFSPYCLFKIAQFAESVDIVVCLYGMLLFEYVVQSDPFKAILDGFLEFCVSEVYTVQIAYFENLVVLVDPLRIS